MTSIRKIDEVLKQPSRIINIIISSLNIAVTAALSSKKRIGAVAGFVSLMSFSIRRSIITFSIIKSSERSYR